jgi:ribosomal protein L11 methyltransferase
VLRCTEGEVELLGEVLFGLGATAVVERPAGDGGVELEFDLDASALAELRRRGLAPEVVARDDSWRFAWHRHATVWRVGSLVLRPPWLGAAAGIGAVGGEVEGEISAAAGRAIEVVIDPGDAFGSGSHPSTRGCLELLQRHRPGEDRRWDVLDVGCGSGVLGIAALLLGAHRAVGIDIDPAALEAGRRNAEANGVGARFEVTDGPLDSVPGRYEVVMANLLIPDIEQLGADLVDHVAPGGILVLGGLLEGHRDRALRAVRPVEVAGEQPEDGWLTLAVTPVLFTPHRAQRDQG